MLMPEPELVCRCIEQRLSSHTCDKCGRPRLDVFDKLALANAREKKAFMAGLQRGEQWSDAPYDDNEQEWQQYRCQDDSDWRSTA